MSRHLYARESFMDRQAGARPRVSSAAARFAAAAAVSVTDKLTDATDSQDQEGVDIAKVERAIQALDKGDMPQVRLLLEQSIGAGPT